MKRTEDYLFAKVAGFSFDIGALKSHFYETVSRFPATSYRDNRVDYIGWAVTSRDGSLGDGVQRISTKSKPGEKPGNNRRGMARTGICTGALEAAMDDLETIGFKPYRARLMSLTNEGEAMPFHTDAKQETWRLHIPIVTNEHCFFEWQRPGGAIESVHLPANGSAWLVRVDIDHRAVNFSGTPCERVHLLMGLNELPDIKALGQPRILIG
jgi:hypothetical protein